MTRKTSSVKVLRTVAEIVSWLGGTSRASRWAGYASPSGVGNWITDDEIPPAYHYRLHLRAQHEDKRIDPSAFGLNSRGEPVEQQTQRRVA